MMGETKPKTDAGLRIMCPTLTCRKILAVPAAARGKTVRCKYCNASIRVPAKKEPAVAPSLPPEGGAEKQAA